MSWDIWLEIDTGGDEPSEVPATDFNYTSNVNPMLREAGLSWRELAGKPASVAVEVIERAIKRLKLEPKKYRAMNPPNGWGDYDSLVEYLERIRNSWEKHPKAIVGLWD